MRDVRVRVELLAPVLYVGDQWTYNQTGGNYTTNRLFFCNRGSLTVISTKWMGQEERSRNRGASEI